ncbi:MAG: uracil-DNA glycosylase [Verrucomicrobia bacterium]|nr:uracil-DNA glycosylase [Verrucomicrobiota bacterium]
MKEELAAVYEELNRLKEAGLERVAIAPETLEMVEALLPKDSPKASKVEVLQPEATEAIPVSKTPEKPVAPAPEPDPPAPAFPEPPVIDLPEGTAAEQLEALRAMVNACETCKAHLSGDGKVVFGTGSAQADIFFCGEAPGADEAKVGEPFIGAAGQLLTKIISAMGLDRESVYIANILKWRPEHEKPYGNRPPTLEEMRFCMPYLKAQIEIIKPKVLIALGNIAVTGLLGHDPKRRMGQVRGKWHDYEGIDLMITFHPAYLLRNDTMKTKRMVWEDMLEVMRKTKLEISEQQQGFFLPKD